jgi:GNAT superfamily N-acetyltransferase
MAQFDTIIHKFSVSMAAIKYWTRWVWAGHAGAVTRQMESFAAKHTPDIVVEPMASAADARAFRELNEEWIARLFGLEEHDRTLLDDPEREILGNGGHVLIARDGGAVVGCVALLREGAGVFELAKMTVAASHRGRGVGRAILRSAVDAARRDGATSLYLGSNRRLADAVHLYESMGFRHVPPREIGPMPYDRADVFMKLDLTA